MKPFEATRRNLMSALCGSVCVLAYYLLIIEICMLEIFLLYHHCYCQSTPIKENLSRLNALSQFMSVFCCFLAFSMLWLVVPVVLLHTTAFTEGENMHPPQQIRGASKQCGSLAQSRSDTK